MVGSSFKNNNNNNNNNNRTLNIPPVATNWMPISVKGNYCLVMLVVTLPSSLTIVLAKMFTNELLFSTLGLYCLPWVLLSNVSSLLPKCNDCVLENVVLGEASWTMVCGKTFQKIGSLPIEIYPCK